MSSYALSLLLAVVACVIGGTLGGLTLARPQATLGLAGVKAGDDGAPPLLTEGRAFGGLLIFSHAGAALYLGYQPSIGAAMAFALAIGWFGAGLGQVASLLIDRTQGRLNLSHLLFEVLIGVTLCLPFFNAGRLVLRGGYLA